MVTWLAREFSCADAQGGGIELGLGGVPLRYQFGIARRRAGLQARGDAVGQAAIGGGVAGELAARCVEHRLLLRNSVGERCLIGAQLLDALAHRLGAGLG